MALHCYHHLIPRYVRKTAYKRWRCEIMGPSTSDDMSIRRNILSNVHQQASYCEDQIVRNLNSRLLALNTSLDSMLIRNTSEFLIEKGWPFSIYRSDDSIHCSRNFFTNFTKFNAKSARRRNGSRNWHSFFTKLLAQMQFVRLLFLLTTLDTTFAFVAPLMPDKTTADSVANQRHLLVEGLKTDITNNASNYQPTESPIYFATYVNTTQTSRTPIPGYSPTTKQQFYSTIGVPVHYGDHLDSSACHFSVYKIKITKESWNAYDQFLKNLCYDNLEMPIDGQILNNMDSGYFAWEENFFHQELRKIILPQTKNNRLTSLIGTHYLKTLDSRIFMSPPKSMCRFNDNVNESEMNAEDLKKVEAQQFEDKLLNRVFNEQSPYPV